MRARWVNAGVLGLLIFTAGLRQVSAGDAYSGKVIETKSAEVVLVVREHDRFQVRLAGVDAPKEGPAAERARKFVSDMVLGKEIRARFEGRSKEGEMVSRVFVADTGKDVGLELIKEGLARRQKDYDYKYGELSRAEGEAQKAKRGIWSAAGGQ